MLGGESCSWTGHVLAERFLALLVSAAAGRCGWVPGRGRFAALFLGDNGNCNAGNVGYAGGNWNNDLNAGPFQLNVNYSLSNTNTNIGGRLTCGCAACALRMLWSDEPYCWAIVHCYSLIFMWFSMSF